MRPPIPGIDLPGIYTLRNLADVDRIKERVDHGVKQAVVVGAGFIGLELVENFVKRGIATTVVELQDQVLPPFDKEMTTPVVETLSAKGVAVLLGNSAEGFEQNADGLRVRLKSGQNLPAQLVILGVGVRPESKLAVDAGLDVGPRGGIRVNDHLQTSDSDIYAVGDAIEVKDTVLAMPLKCRWPDPPTARAHRGRQYPRSFGPLSRHAGHGDRGRLRTNGRHDRCFGKGSASGPSTVPQDLHPPGESRGLLSRRRSDGPQSAVRADNRSSCWERRPSAGPALTSGSTCSPWRSRPA